MVICLPNPLLVIDDVNDTGETLKAVFSHIQSLEPALFKTAVLHEKNTTVFKADFVVKRLDKWKWLTYQWAVTEDILSFLKKDQLLDADAPTIQMHLTKKYKLKINKTLLQHILNMRNNYL